MATKRFKQNLVSLFKLFKSEEELCEFLDKKDAFSERFIKSVTEADYLSKIKDFDQNLNMEEINEMLHYDVGYKKGKISVDITKNDVFSYLDSDEDLIKKMDNYIKNEEFEKAIVLRNYFQTIELKYK
jgi:hypothetical protein